MDKLWNRVSEGEARIGILGLGYVGLPLGVEFARKGFKVTGFDVRQDLLRNLSRGVSHVADVPSAVVGELVKAGRFRPTSRFDGLRACDAVIICVPTPLRKSKEPDVSYILSASQEISKRLRKGQLIILESTTYPGTTRELVLPLFEKGKLRVGRDFHLAFSPERVDPGNKTFRIANTPKVVGGITSECTRIACHLYGQVVERVVPVSSTEAAEMVKLLENTFRAVNIAMVNEMSLMCYRLKLNAWEIISAAATKPFGFMPFYPGPGIGGHCIPLDPQYLAWKMKSLNFEPRFIELAGVVNAAMPEHVLERVGEMLNSGSTSLKGSRVLIMGVAYKPNVSDVRESPALDVIQLLKGRGANVCYHDPWVSRIEVVGQIFKSRALTERLIRQQDLTMILTAHAGIDYRWVLRKSKRVFDARNALSGVTDPKLYRL